MHKAVHPNPKRLSNQLLINLSIQKETESLRCVRIAMVKGKGGEDIEGRGDETQLKLPTVEGEEDNSSFS